MRPTRWQRLVEFLLPWRRRERRLREYFRRLGDAGEVRK
jgi:hypothetical protein